MCLESQLPQYHYFQMFLFIPFFFLFVLVFRILVHQPGELRPSAMKTQSPKPLHCQELSPNFYTCIYLFLYSNFFLIYSDLFLTLSHSNYKLIMFWSLVGPILFFALNFIFIKTLTHAFENQFYGNSSNHIKFMRQFWKN